MAMEQEREERQSQLRFTKMPTASLTHLLPDASGRMPAASPSGNMALRTKSKKESAVNKHTSTSQLLLSVQAVLSIPSLGAVLLVLSWGAWGSNPNGKGFTLSLGAQH